jgi:hypothetical protein
MADSDLGGGERECKGGEDVLTPPIEEEKSLDFDVSDSDTNNVPPSTMRCVCTQGFFMWSIFVEVVI